MSKVSSYLKSKKPGWYVSNILLAAILSILIIPSWRQSFGVFFIQIFNGAPTLEATSIPIPEDAYLWELIDLQEAEWWSFSETKGEVVFINYWATWCGPCVAEMQSIQDLYDEYKDRVRFILISTEEPKKIKVFRDRYQYTLPFNSVINAPPVFQTNKYPTTYIVNKEGIIVSKQYGSHDWNSEKVHNFLDKILAE